MKPVPKSTDALLEEAIIRLEQACGLAEALLDRMSGEENPRPELALVK